MMIGVQVVDADGSGLSAMVPLDTDTVSCSSEDIMCECQLQFILMKRCMSIPFSNAVIADMPSVKARVWEAVNSQMPF